MPTPFTQRQPVPSPRYGPVLRPIRPQLSYPSHHPYTVLHQRTITRAQNLPRKGGLERQPSKFTLFALLRYRLHNRLLGTRQALHEAHSPLPHDLKKIPSHQHKGLFTDLKGQISDSTSLPTLLELVQLKASTSLNELITPPRHPTILSSPRPALANSDSWKTSMSRKVGSETSPLNVSTSRSTLALQNASVISRSTSSLSLTARMTTSSPSSLLHPRRRSLQDLPEI